MARGDGGGGVFSCSLGPYSIRKESADVRSYTTEIGISLCADCRWQ